MAAIAPRPMVGQELRGVVRDSASRLPIPGAVVTLQDSASQPLARTTTSERGEFRIALLNHDAVRRIRVVRLGFRPISTRLPDPVDGVIRVELDLATISMRMAPVAITAERPARCPRRRDGLVAMAVLDQARAGLLATIVARSERWTDSPIA